VRYAFVAISLVLAVLATPGGIGAVSRSCDNEIVRQDSNAVWSPDGSRIAFVRVHSYSCIVDDGLVGEAHWSVETIDAAGGHRASLFSLADPLTVSWSPEGTRLAIVSFDRIVIVDAGNGSVVLDRRIRLGVVGRAPTWSADGRRVAAYDQILDTSSGAVMTVGVVNAPPGWSPDGAHAAVLATDGLEIVDLVGGSRQWIGPGGLAGGSVSWSSDGRWIAYEAGTGLRFVHPDGTSLRTFPSLSGAILGWRGDSVEIFNGSALQQVTVDGHVETSVLLRRFYPDGGLPAIAPSGRIVFGGTDLCPRIGIFVAPAKRLSNDCIIRGTRRADRIVGTSLPDAILALAGNDIVRTRDQSTDVVDCGTGRDTAIVDTTDRVRACERVLRRPYP
jgi:dipeptidyl aminopeptidase/acylaminoacyl peptidase